MRLMAPVGLPSADGTPPHVAQVPMAMVAAAPGARRRNQVAVGTGCGLPPSTASTPMAEKYPPVRHRALVDDHVGDTELTFPRVGEGLHELRARFNREHRVMEDHPGHGGNDPGEKTLDSWIGRPGHRDRAAITAHAGKPVDMDGLERPERQSLSARLRLRLGPRRLLDLEDFPL